MTKQLADPDIAQLARFSIDRAADPVFWTDLQARFIYVNDAACRTLGYTRAELLALTVFDIDPTFSPAAWPARCQELAQRSTFTVESQHRTQSGHVFPVEISLNYLEFDGQAYIFAVMRDITERKRAETEREERVREGQRLLQAFLDNFPDMAFAIDGQGRFILSNHWLEMALSFEPGKLIGKTAHDLFPKELADQKWALERRVMETGEPFTIEEPVPRNGVLYTKFTTLFPIYDTHGKITAAGGLAIDITAQKQAEAERERLQQEIIEAQKHAIKELSTPIIPIMDRILVMPLIGSVDTLRARDITRALLAGISQYRAKVVIIDITGVPLVDSGVADHLNKTIQAARLKGARTIVTGISDAVAEAIVDLGIDWSGLQTLSDLQSGLMAALDSLGVRLVKSA